MMTEFTRDAAATAAIFGFFAASWFGWAQEHPPASWRSRLVAGTILSLLVALGGALLTWQHWSDRTAFNPSSGRTFGLIVGIEFAIAGSGAGVLIALGKAEMIAAWVALIVGLHLFPLAPLLNYPMLYVAAALVSMVGLAAVPLARTQSVAVSAVTGLATGVVLLLAALFSLLTAVA